MAIYGPWHKFGCPWSGWNKLLVEYRALWAIREPSRLLTMLKQLSIVSYRSSIILITFIVQISLEVTGTTTVYFLLMNVIRTVSCD